MSVTKANVVLFMSDPESDDIVLQVLKKHDFAPTVLTKVKEVCRQLVDKTPKIFLMTGDDLERSISNYYRALEAVREYSICEHKMVTLIPRQCEEDAFKAHQAGIVDDYLVARPVYELHRIILICTHLFNELGVGHPATRVHRRTLGNIEKFDDVSRKSVLRGLEYKESLKAEFEKSVVEIENAIEGAIEKLKRSEDAKVNISKLSEALASIKSDEIRPELLQLQSKAMKLLETAMGGSAEEEPEAQPVPQEKPKSEATTPQSAPAEEPKEEKKNYVFNRLYQQNIDPDEVLTKAKTKPTILIVEDDVISLQLTQKLLSRYPLKLEAAKTGRDAFASLSNKKYELVFMDINLPDTNGVYIVDQITNGSGPNAETPIIMLSGNKHKATVAQAMERGAKGYIVKPLHKKSVDKLMEKYIQLPSGAAH